MKRIWNTFMLKLEIYAYHRVLSECSDRLSLEHRQRIYNEIAIAKQRLST